MKRLGIGIIVCIFSLATAFYLWSYYKTTILVISPLSTKKPKEKPLNKYAFANLQRKVFTPSIITIGDIIKEEDTYSSYFFFFIVDGKRVSGMLNLPTKSGRFPIVVMFRGYVDREQYTTGEGTRRAGEKFAQEGFITVSPDFLGYGSSDNPSNDPIEERFQTYTTVLTLLASLQNLNSALKETNINIEADTANISLWGHSNGGHIALSTLAISKKAYPTVLWNPVSKPFPYSILYYTDEFVDLGKSLRRVLANFEKDYDVEKYSPVNYYKDIQAPIQLHQADNDEAVPPKWSDKLVEKLRSLNKEIEYYTYPGDDHNFSRGSWNLVVARNILFYRSHLTSE